MTTISSPPASPISRRKRQSLRISSTQSAYDSTSSSIFASGTTSSFQSRRSSQTSIQQPPYSPATQRSFSIRSKRPSSSRLSIGSNISAGLASNTGFGNLADELEEALNDDYILDSPSFLVESPGIPPQADPQSPSQILEHHLTSPRSPQVSSSFLEPPEKPQSPSKQWTSMGTPHRKSESFYGGSDHYPSSEDEAFDKIAPTLQRRIRHVEEITKISSRADTLPELENVIPRTISALKTGLESHPGVENGVTRLVTAYTSMSTHRTHQFREIANISGPLLNNTSYSQSLLSLPVETIELLVAELDSLIETLPFLHNASIESEDSTPLLALQTLATSTQDMFSNLQSLSDTLTENRQNLLAATRRLKNVRDLVDDLIMEEELVETSMMLIQAGDWDRRCKERKARKMVEEILGGFKRTWNVEYADDCWRPGLELRKDVAVG